MNSVKFAKVISIIFVPPSISLLISIYIALNNETPESLKLPVVLTALFCGFIIPIVFFFIFKSIGIVADLDVSNKDERTVPYLMGVTLSLVAFYTANYFNLPVIIKAMWIIFVFNSVISVIVNSYWKISAHAQGIATLLAFVLWFSYPHAAVVFVLLIMIGWARIVLKKHTPLQVVIGALFGLFSSLLQLSFLTKILG